MTSGNYKTAKDAYNNATTPTAAQVNALVVAAEAVIGIISGVGTYTAIQTSVSQDNIYKQLAILKNLGAGTLSIDVSDTLTDPDSNTGLLGDGTSTNNTANGLTTAGTGVIRIMPSNSQKIEAELVADATIQLGTAYTNKNNVLGSDFNLTATGMGEVSNYYGSNPTNSLKVELKTGYYKQGFNKTENTGDTYAIEFKNIYAATSTGAATTAAADTAYWYGDVVVTTADGEYTWTNVNMTTLLAGGTALPAASTTATTINSETTKARLSGSAGNIVFTYNDDTTGVKKNAMDLKVTFDTTTGTFAVNRGQSDTNSWTATLNNYSSLNEFFSNMTTNNSGGTGSVSNAQTMVATLTGISDNFSNVAAAKATGTAQDATQRLLTYAQEVVKLADAVKGLTAGTYTATGSSNYDAIYNYYRQLAALGAETTALYAATQAADGFSALAATGYLNSATATKGVYVGAKGATVDVSETVAAGVTPTGAATGNDVRQVKIETNGKLTITYGTEVLVFDPSTSGTAKLSIGAASGKDLTLVYTTGQVVVTNSGGSTANQAVIANSKTVISDLSTASGISPYTSFALTGTPTAGDLTDEDLAAIISATSSATDATAALYKMISGTDNLTTAGKITGLTRTGSTTEATAFQIFRATVGGVPIYVVGNKTKSNTNKNDIVSPSAGWNNGTYFLGGDLSSTDAQGKAGAGVSGVYYSKLTGNSDYGFLDWKNFISNSTAVKRAGTGKYYIDLEVGTTAGVKIPALPTDLTISKGEFDEAANVNLEIDENLTGNTGKKAGTYSLETSSYAVDVDVPDANSATYNGVISFSVANDNALRDSLDAAIDEVYMSYQVIGTDLTVTGIGSTSAIATSTVSGWTMDGSEVTVGGVKYALTAATYSDITLESLEEVAISDVANFSNGAHDTLRLWYTDIEGNDIIRTSVSGGVGYFVTNEHPEAEAQYGGNATLRVGFDNGNEYNVAVDNKGDVVTLQKRGAVSDTSIAELSAYTIPGATTEEREKRQRGKTLKKGKGKALKSKKEKHPRVKLYSVVPPVV